MYVTTARVTTGQPDEGSSSVRTGVRTRSATSFAGVTHAFAERRKRGEKHYATLCVQLFCVQRAPAWYEPDGSVPKRSERPSRAKAHHFPFFVSPSLPFCEPSRMKGASVEIHCAKKRTKTRSQTNDDRRSFILQCARVDD